MNSKQIICVESYLYEDCLKKVNSNGTKCKYNEKDDNINSFHSQIQIMLEHC